MKCVNECDCVAAAEIGVVHVGVQLSLGIIILCESTIIILYRHCM